MKGYYYCHHSSLRNERFFDWRVLMKDQISTAKTRVFCPDIWKWRHCLFYLCYMNFNLLLFVVKPKTRRFGPRSGLFVFLFFFLNSNFPTFSVAFSWTLPVNSLVFDSLCTIYILSVTVLNSINTFMVNKFINCSGSQARCQRFFQFRAGSFNIWYCIFIVRGMRMERLHHWVEQLDP